ncbi:NADAR family protein [Kiloniella sp.]|uniref:NADAR family protein n=1 Tax=Kiloniella sp. TaxID=1938587 RepID=UPI003B027D88
MKNKIDLIHQVNTGKRVKYVFFWGEKSSGHEITRACFSQWYSARFESDGISYSSAEHFMMAEKAKLFDDVETLQKIITARNPGAAKAFGRQVKGFNEEIWQEHRFDIVVKASLLKFGQNPELKDFLIKTGRRVLVEASPLDKIWGIGLAADDPKAENPQLWEGENLLGFALMEARGQLLEEV